MAVPPTALADVKITSPSAESAVVGSAPAGCIAILMILKLPHSHAILQAMVDAIRVRTF